MGSINITAVSRFSTFSPNNIGNDAAIFQGTIDFLKENGCEICTLTEPDFISMNSIISPFVLTMMRSVEAVNRLKYFEQKGVIAVNSAFGIANCAREPMTRLLLEHEIPYPESILISVKEQLEQKSWNKAWDAAWVKRADSQAVEKEDVSFVTNLKELTEVMSNFDSRKIDRAVINRHIDGDLVKFYGVAGTDFFYWFYPLEGHHSKFGLEAINGVPKGLKFDKYELRDICNEAANTLSVDVYGGDCVVSSDGSIKIIDFNDWPSFAPCRKEAAIAIGRAVLNKFK